jgi:hypothetical protein
MSDEISRLSDQLARDPASLTFLALGEALRKRGQLDLSLRVTTPKRTICWRASGWIVTNSAARSMSGTW